MKNIILSVLVLAATIMTCGATSEVVPAPMTVIVDSESKQLASGYALAFTRFRHVPFHVQLQREGGKIITINDIKSATPAAGVLLLETNKGLFYAINPKDVIWLSDAPVAVEKPAPSDAK